MNSPLLWIATSGTTSNLNFPKRWIAHTRSSLESSAAQVCRWLNVCAEDRWARILSPKHMGGLSLDIRATVSGCSVLDNAPAWDPVKAAHWLNDEKATLVSAVPTQIFDWVKAKVSAPPSLRVVVVGADRLEPALAFEARSLGWPIVSSYGSTEAASMIACEKIEAPNNCGWLPILPHIDATITVDGFFAFQSPALFEAELLWDEKSMRYRYEPRDSTLPWITSDRARLRSGNLQILGRGDDVIKILGVNIDLAELDRRLSILLKSEGILNAAVFVGRPDERSGYRLEIILEKFSGQYSESLLQRTLSAWNKNCASIEKASSVVSIENFPRTELGKLRRRLL